MAAPMQMQQNQQLPPPQHQQHQQHQQQQQQQQQQQNPQQTPQHLDSDPVAKFKNLLPRLKESLVVLVVCTVDHSKVDDYENCLSEWRKMSSQSDIYSCLRRLYFYVLFKAAGEVFRHHASQDSGSRPVEKPQVKFEKCLEEFYALCDQIEMNLKSALEISCQFVDSMKYTPFPVVSSFKIDPPPEAANYQQYLLTIRMQINYATEIHDVLSEFASKLTDQPT